MIENMLAGWPPFRPELGLGGSSWFVVEGTPYTGVGAGNNIPVQTDRINTRNAVRYGQPTLERIFAEVRASGSQVGEGILSGGSPTPGGPPVFSATPGRFTGTPRY
ncbi:hypothetical protein, partial [Frankia sp. Cr2]|uniref:hypothetical protein n=1 Tax=Frankia sp. Cr2 TaxID=3073932 RepID=UPI002AD42FAF